jgi:hypothetical protein
MGRLNLIFVAGLETFPIAKMQQRGADSQSENGECKLALSRHCHPLNGARGCFPGECGFQVIYFVSNIFFLAGSKVCSARACKTAG